MARSRLMLVAFMTTSLAACASVLGIGDLPPLPDAASDGSTLGDGDPNIDVRDAPAEGSSFDVDAGDPLACRKNAFGPFELVAVPSNLGATFGAFRMVTADRAYVGQPSGPIIYEYAVKANGDNIDPSATAVQITGSSTGGKNHPFLLDEGRTLVFEANVAERSLVVATRSVATGPFSNEAQLLFDADGGTEEYAPWFIEGFPAAPRLYFSSNRSGKRQLYVAAGLTSTAQPVSGVASAFNDSHPVVTPDAKLLFFSRDESGNADIWVAENPGSGFTAPSKIAALSSGSAEYPTYVTPNGCTLFFMRAGALYRATR